MQIKKIIEEKELQQFAKFCDTHTIIEGTYADAFLLEKDKSLSRFMK